MQNSHPLRILVIEDNPGDFFLLKERLAETSVEVGEISCAETMAQATALLKKNTYDIVLLDLSLPDASGADTFLQVKPLLPDTPVIVLSGMSDLKLALQTIQEGAQDYLLKDHLNPSSLDKSIYYSIERMRYTKKMLESAERLHFQSIVLANITDSVIVTDLNKNVFFWNKAATEIYGYSEEEMIGKNMSVLLIDKEDGTDPVSLTKRLKTESPFRKIVRRKTKSGAVIWVELNISYYYDVDQKITGLIGISKDVTDLKAEEHLLTLFQSVILNSNDAVIITDALGTDASPVPKIVFVNRAFTNMTGYPAEEMIGTDLMRLSGPLTDLAEVDRIRRAMLFWEPVESTLAYYRKDGKAFWVTLTITPVSDHSGRFTHWVFIQRDVTEVRQAAELLREQNEELSKANRELDRFVYSASHDLRAPLTSVLGLVELMRKEDFAPSASIYLDKVQTSIQRLDQLIQNIINYSRNSRLEPKYLPIDFRELFDASISMHRFIDNSKEIKIVYDNQLGGDFYSDPERWQIVLNNLVSNSIKFSRPGENTQIRLLVHKNDHAVQVRFEDNGVGIAPEQTDRVFNMFYRATDGATGSGLGLYIVKQTVELLGGTIQLESEPGRYTRFTIRIPFVPNPKEYAEKSS